MLCEVHCTFGKRGSRKQISKVEAMVFASDQNRAEELVRQMFENYPVEFIWVTSSVQQRDLDIIHANCPELEGIDSADGYIFSAIKHSMAISKYFK